MQLSCLWPAPTPARGVGAQGGSFSVALAPAHYGTGERRGAQQRQRAGHGNVVHCAQGEGERVVGGRDVKRRSRNSRGSDVVASGTERQPPTPAPGRVSLLKPILGMKSS